MLCASSGCNAAATEASQIDGVSKVLSADDEAYGNGLAEPISDLVVALSSDFEHIVAPATNSAKNILPRVAALLDVMDFPDQPHLSVSSPQPMVLRRCAHHQKL